MNNLKGYQTIDTIDYKSLNFETKKDVEKFVIKLSEKTITDIFNKLVNVCIIDPKKVIDGSRTTFVVNKLKEYNLLTPVNFRGFLSDINHIEVAIAEEKTDVDVENSSINHRPIYTDPTDAIIDQLKQGISTAWRLEISRDGAMGSIYEKSKYFTTKEAAIKDSPNYDYTSLEQVITVVDDKGEVCALNLDNLRPIYLHGKMDENLRKLQTEKKEKRQKLENRRQLESLLEKEQADQEKITQLRKKLGINNH